MAQAKSKLVRCEICGRIMYARGLHPHMRQVHHEVFKTVTKVGSSEPDYSPTIVDQGDDFSRLTIVDEKIITRKKTKAIPSNGGRKGFHSCDFFNQLDAHASTGKNVMRINHELSVEEIMGTMFRNK